MQFARSACEGQIFRNQSKSPNNCTYSNSKYLVMFLQMQRILESNTKNLIQELSTFARMPNRPFFSGHYQKRGEQYENVKN